MKRINLKRATARVFNVGNLWGDAMPKTNSA